MTWKETVSLHYKILGKYSRFVVTKHGMRTENCITDVVEGGKCDSKLQRMLEHLSWSTKLQFVPIQKIRISEIWYFWIRISLLVRRVQQWHHLPTSQCSVPSVQPQRRELMLLPCQIPNIIDRSTDIPHIQNHEHINDLERVVMHQMCHY